MPPQLIDLPAHTVFFRRLYAGSWAEAEGRPQRNEFDLRDEDTGLSVFLESKCTAEEVLAGGKEGCGLTLFVYGDISPCFGAYESDDGTLSNLSAAHVELRLRADPARRRFPKAKLLALAKRAGEGVIRLPAASR